MARRLSTMVAIVTNIGIIGSHRRHQSRTGNDSQSSAQTTSLSEDDHQIFLERHRLLSAKVERCVQELIERVHKQNPALKFDLLAPPAQSPPVMPNESKEVYLDFYVVWKNPGQIHIQRDPSSICCTIKLIDSSSKLSRAEEGRLILSNIDKRKTRYLNGRGMRDLFFETLHQVAPDLIRLDFVEHLIYFDLIIPSNLDKFTCHITLFPCLHPSVESDVFLPFGTLRWYPRSLSSPSDPYSALSLQYPPLILPIRRYMSSTEDIDEATIITRQDQQAFSRVRAIIREMFSSYILEHADSIEQLRTPFNGDDTATKRTFFLPHKSDRNCNVFPAGQHLLNDPRARRFMMAVLRANTKIVADPPQPSDDGVKV